MQYSAVVRVTAFILALLASLSAPGAALAHGLAHHREQQSSHEHHEAHEGRERSGAHRTPTMRADTTWVDGESAPELSSRHDGHATAVPGSHGHPVLDFPFRPRTELPLAVAVTAAATVLLSAELRVPAATPVPHEALPRADPGAEPLPRPRAPPLR